MSPDFRRLLGAEAVSNFGSMLSRVAIPWIATLTLAATPFDMGILVIADVAAGAIATLLLGAIVDRSEKRTVMLAADFELARSAWMAERIAAPGLAGGNAQMAAATSLSETIAFALGGWLYQGLGAVLALAVDALSYVVSALFVRGVSRSPSTRTPDSRGALATLITDAREGIAALRATRTLRVLAGVEVLVAPGMSLAGTSYMIFVARDLGFGTGALGMIFATGGIGALLGAALAPRLGRRLGHGRAMRIGLALFALGAFCIPLAPGATFAGAALLVAHQVIGVGGHTVFSVHDRTLRQTAVGAELLARVDAGIRTLGQFARLAGAVGGGALATLVGTQLALFVSAALFAGAALLARIRPA
jgi:Na+/melibiose symporter-like transporter